MASLTISASINYGASLRIGYKIKNSSNPFTYHNHYPTSNELPYLLNGLTAGIYQVELTQICPNCSGGIYSDPVVLDATVV